MTWQEELEGYVRARTAPLEAEIERLQNAEKNLLTMCEMKDSEIGRWRAALEDCAAELFGGKDGSPARLDSLLAGVNELLSYGANEQNAPAKQLCVHGVSLDDDCPQCPSGSASYGEQ